MIVEYDNEGRIFHILSDPVHESVVQALRDMGSQFLDLPTIPWPPEPVTSVDTGEPIIDEETQSVVFASQGYDSPDVDSKRDYVFDGAITPRPTFEVPELVEIVANGTDERVIENLPEGASLMVDGEVHVLEGTTLTIASDMPAEYTIFISKFPYTEKTIKVIAHAA